MMKCLSIKPPWTHIRMNNKQSIEVRGWQTPHRGDFLIHASQNVDTEACKKLDLEPGIKGAILGYIKLSKIERASVLLWDKMRDDHNVEGYRLFGNSTFLWYLQNPHKFKNPIPYQGTQGFFDVPGTILSTKKIVLPAISPDMFKEILPIICNKDTSFDPNGWSQSNPLWGHSAIVSLLTQDLYGGEIVCAPVSDVKEFKSLKSHYWNLLPDGTEIDFTKEQFGKKYPEELKPRGRSREYLLSNESTLKRYKHLAAGLAKLYRFALTEGQVPKVDN